MADARYHTRHQTDSCVDKVLRKIGFYLPEEILVAVSNNQAGIIESVLIQLKRHVSIRPHCIIRTHSTF